jgi:hypothetical protein
MMKKRMGAMRKMLGIGIVVTVVALAVAGCAEKGDHANEFRWTWADEGGGVAITEYVGKSQTVKIPAKIDGKKVTVIEGFANKELNSVTIPKSVTTIGELAFSDNQLTSVTIPDSVTTIGRQAFYDNQLNSVTIPKSVTTIGELAFSYNQLTSVTIPDSVTEIGSDAFSKNQLTSVTIPKSVTFIGWGIFRNNKITSIVMPAAFELYPLLGLSDSFDNFYYGNGRKAGTYTTPSADSDNWSYK